MSVLTTERLVLRPPVPGDVSAYMAYSASPRYVAERGTRSAPERWSYFATLLGHWQIRGWGRFMVTDRTTGTILGHMGPLQPEGWPEREIAWHLWSAQSEGKGLAREAARAILAHVFGHLGWPTAVSYIAPGNARSRALAERLGAAVDAEATGPDFGPDHPVLVYRHPRPEGLA